VNFLVRVPFLSRPFSLLRRLVVGDHQHRHHAVVPRSLGQPPRALLLPREITGSGHGARTECEAKEDGNPDKGDPPAVSQPQPLSSPLTRSLTSGPRVPHVSIVPTLFPLIGSPRGEPHPLERACTRACTCPMPLTSGPGATVAPPVRHPWSGVPALAPYPTRVDGPWALLIRHTRLHAHPLVLISAVDPTSDGRGDPIPLRFCCFVERTLDSLVIEPVVPGF
jgi:hypothetical protein